MEPFEIVAHPLTVFLAPVGTSFPDVHDDPDDFDADWFRLGASGPENYDDDGVTVQHPQSIEEWFGSSVQPVKAFRTEERLVVSFTLVDIGIDSYARMLGNDDDVTENTDDSEFNLARGHVIQTYALLARGLSPADNDLHAQYQIPYCYPGGEPEVQYQKGDPAGLAFEYTALADPEASSNEERFGKLVVATDVPAP